MIIKYTKYISKTPVSKEFSFDKATRKKDKRSLGEMFEATAAIIDSDLKTFGESLAAMTSFEACSFGLPLPKFGDGSIQVTTNKRRAQFPDAMVRDTKDMTFRKGAPGIFFVDYDPSPYGPKPLSPKQFLKILFAADPQLALCEYVVRGSVSAGVRVRGSKVTAGASFHIYFSITDMSAIPDYGKLLYNRLWLAGHGFMALSSVGSMMERTLVDSCVWQPNRLDFTGQPIIVSDELIYAAPEMTYVPGASIDPKLLPRLTVKELKDLQDRKTEGRSKRQPDVQAVKDAYVKATTARLIKDGGFSPQDAAGLARERTERTTFKLMGWDRLQFKNPQLGDVMVRDVLTDPSRFEGEALVDPDEDRGSYPDDSARFYWNKGVNPLVISWGHGGDRNFKLIKDYDNGSDSNDVNDGGDVLGGGDGEDEGVANFGAGRQSKGARNAGNRRGDRGGDNGAGSAGRGGSHNDSGSGSNNVGGGMGDWEKLTYTITKAGVYEDVMFFEEALRDTGRYFNVCGMVSMPADGKFLAIKPREYQRLLNKEFSLQAYVQTKTGLELIDVAAPKSHHEQLFCMGGINTLHSVKSIAKNPFLFKDEIINVSGHHAEAEIFGMFDEREYVIGSTREDAKKALILLKKLNKGFCFAEADKDGAYLLAAELLGTIRSSLSVAPGIHINGNMAGAGKSQAGELISLFANPTKVSAVGIPTRSEDFEKTLLSCLIPLPTVLHFDNLTKDIFTLPMLASVFTSEFIAGRILGQSSMVDVSTRTLIITNGNNIEPVGDMCRRMGTINLISKSEYGKVVEHIGEKPVPAMSAQRAKYISAALTIINAWIKAGKPKSDSQAISNFHEWQEYCCEPLIWLGESNPAQMLVENILEDINVDETRDFLELWFKVYGYKEVTVSQIMGEIIFDSKGKVVQEHNYNTKMPVRDFLIREWQSFAGNGHPIRNQNITHLLKTRYMNKIISGKKLIKTQNKTDHKLHFKLIKKR